MIRSARLSSGMWHYAAHVLLLAAWAAAVSAAEAPASAPDDVFAVTVAATGRSPDELKPAYLDALKRVIVAVTGREEAGRDAALLARFGDPADYVERYRADGPGIRVQFDRTLVREVLVTAGYLATTADAALAGTGSRTAIQVVVSNINRADDYGAVLQIFRAVEPGASVAVLGAAGEAVTFLVSSRAGAEAFRSAVAEQGSLQPDAPESGQAGAGEAMRFRYASGL